jgi:histidinol-phosphate/aromatic aminotransferase/cobyric acid decarboxylase-like protein
LVNGDEHITQRTLRTKMKTYESLLFGGVEEDWAKAVSALMGGHAGRAMRDLFLHADLLKGMRACFPPARSRMSIGVVILRTFSKAYGMAGIRAGMAMAHPDLLEKLCPYGTGMLPITGLAAATASLKVKTLIAERRRINADVREDVFNWLEQKKFTYVPSVSNKFMLETHKPGMATVEGMRKENVYIGRVWPAWPTHVRVTIGTQEEMNKFKTALLKVMT